MRGNIMDTIWMDVEAYNGKGYKGENDTEQTVIPGPENKRDCPCDTCPMNAMCLRVLRSVVPCVTGVLRETIKTRTYNAS